MSNSPSRAVAAFYEALSCGDIAMLASVCDNSELYVFGNDPGEDYGPDPRETFVVLERQFEQAAGRYRYASGRMQVREHGSIAFVLDRPTVLGPDGAVTSRLTAICKWESGRWRIIHIHFSVGVENEDTFGEKFAV